ncbi:uncharacterized protein HaLaN_29277 [Haematococcus lacustris]|uniref:Uncharacterized protein n=1 Tax=Haematococcus lacustris TaxID=44745 RepID=A0A6A0ADS3_HAELA|nr:uncharacterized protein HaLaN_29277 [Haematococcus lacustris]
MPSYLSTISSSMVLVGRHSSLMANSMFMRPGTMVLELLPYKWEWAGLSQLYHNITQSVGDIHHFAWRPQHYKFAIFANASDYKYHTWTPEECHAKECLSVMARQSLLVDVPAVEAMLRRKLSAVLQGDSVASLREPWPKAV